MIIKVFNISSCKNIGSFKITTLVMMWFNSNWPEWEVPGSRAPLPCQIQIPTNLALNWKWCNSFLNTFHKWVFVVQNVLKCFLLRVKCQTHELRGVWSGDFNFVWNVYLGFSPDR
jgi:hypothetical protein